MHPRWFPVLHNKQPAETCMYKLAVVWHRRCTHHRCDAVDLRPSGAFRLGKSQSKSWLFSVFNQFSCPVAQHPLPVTAVQSILRRYLGQVCFQVKILVVGVRDDCQPQCQSTMSCLSPSSEPNQLGHTITTPSFGLRRQCLLCPFQFGLLY